MKLSDIYKKISTTRLLKNLSWIFVGNVTYSLLHFLLDVFVARLLPLDTNGLLNYATSMIALASAIVSLGFPSTIEREFAEDNKSIGDTLCTCIFSHAGIAVVAIFVLQVIVRLSAPGESMLHTIVLFQSCSMLFSSMSLCVNWFRYKSKADLVAILRLIVYAVTAGLRIVALAVFKSLELYACFLAAESLLFGSSLVFFFVKNYTGSFSYSFDRLKKILKTSYPFIFAALLITIYGQTDKIMLKSMVSNESVALYSAAVRLAGALAMIPSSLIEAFRPELMDLKFRDEGLYQKRFRMLYCIVFWFCIAYCVFVTLFAKHIIWLLYGEKYLGAVSCLSLCVWYTAFSYFGAIHNVFMVAESKSHWVQINTFAGAACNVVLNYIMIPHWGIMGAAAASFVTQIVANVIMMWVVKDLRKGFKIMVQGVVFHGLR